MKDSLLHGFRAVLLVSLTSVFFGCGINHQGDGSSTLAGLQAKVQDIFNDAQRSSIKIVDEQGNAVAGAQVLIGTALNTPFKLNFLTADQNGQIQSPVSWTQGQPVTISAPGHVRVTYMAQTAHGQSFVLRNMPVEQAIQISGTTPGIVTNQVEGMADFSMVMPALTMADMLSFDISTLVSSEMDQISVLGQKVEIPSNITLPKQHQNYILPLTLNKPNYRMRFARPGQKKLYALHGQFPFNKVVDAVRAGAAFYSLVNDFNMIDAGLLDVNVTANQKSLDIPVGKIQFSSTVEMQSPSMQSDEVLFAAALNPVDGYLLPTDARQLSGSGTQSLKVIAGANEFVAAVLKKKSDVRSQPQDRLSAVIVPLTAGVLPELLPMNEAPQLLAPNSVRVPLVHGIANVKQLATFATLGTVKKDETDPKKESVDVIWEVYANNWVEKIELPTWPNEAPASGAQRWAVALLGGSGEQNLDLGPGIMQAVTHVTKSSIDF